MTKLMGASNPGGGRSSKFLPLDSVPLAMFLVGDEVAVLGTEVLVDEAKCLLESLLGARNGPNDHG